MNGQFNLGSIRPDQYFLTIAVTLGLMFAFVAPDETNSGWSMLLQWQLQTVGPMLLMIASHLALHRFGAFAQLNPWFKLLMSGALGAALFSPVALLLDVGLQGERLAPGFFGPLSNLAHEITNFVPPVVICWIVINAPWVLGWRIEHAQTAQAASGSDTAIDNNHSTNDASESTGLKDLLPSELGDDIVMMKSELHYLLVRTALGKTMLLYNLKDAVNEQDSETGIQCHRSYWVNRSHIKGFHRRGRQGNIELNDGTLVPVSRGNLEMIRAAVDSSKKH